MKFYWSIILIFLSQHLFAVEITGFVYALQNELKEPIPFANVFTEDAKYGTTTDINGRFKLLLPDKPTYKNLTISSVSYQSATVSIVNTTYIEVALKENILQDVVIVRKKSDRSSISPQDIQIIDSKELTKAACCNLSESFETNAAVDVQFADAVTGAKKLKMLGLDGYYTQTVFENSVGIRGLENGLGILFVPGPFMESIAINKGAGSVVNGYDAITGQINYEYKKPYNSERFFINLYGTRQGEMELNTNFSHRLTKKWSTLFLLHGAYFPFSSDENKDSFQDMPLSKRMNLMNRWHYNGKKFESQFGVNAVFDQRTSGQLHTIKSNAEKTRLYDAEIISRKATLFAKTGFVLPKNNQSIGIQYNYNYFDQRAWIGNRFYKGKEHYGRLNFIFQTDMLKANNTLKLGASYVIDVLDETFEQKQYQRTESVPGVFVEYNYQDNEKLAAVIGVRADAHNLHGIWLSPKMNLKYTFLPDFTVKIAASKAYRTANIFAENMSAMVSARRFEIDPNLSYESAWNVGGGLTKKFLIGFNTLQLSADFYHTNFSQQVVIDYEDTRKVAIYSLKGTSIANSFQFEAQYEPVEGLDIKLAYKMDDIYITYKSGMKTVPYIPKHKILATIDYETNNKKWRFNLTSQVKGPSRVPSTAANSIENQRPNTSPWYFTLNAQVTYVLNRFEFYLGGENLTNYKQKDALIAANDPFGTNFDGSMIWGPIPGIRIYGGLRYTLPYGEKLFKQKHIHNENDEPHQH